jgi:hypothetical protein
MIMAVLIPNGAMQGESLASMLCDVIDGVELIDEKVWLIIRPSGDLACWMIPLICPVCGGGWHFDISRIRETLDHLREQLTGYVIAGIHYQTNVTEENIRTMQIWLYQDSGMFEPLVANIPEHLTSSAFPAVSMVLEKRILLDVNLSGTEEEIRARFDIQPQEDFEEVMQDLRDLQGEAFNVEDDIMLLIHPFAILEATEVLDDFL